MSDMTPLRIDRCRPTLLGTEVTIYADRHATATVGSFLGDREFYIPAGHGIRTKLKGKMWQPGDRLTMSGLVRHARNWSCLPWRWTHE